MNEPERTLVCRRRYRRRYSHGETVCVEVDGEKDLRVRKVAGKGNRYAITVKKLDKAG